MSEESVQLPLALVLRTEGLGVHHNEGIRSLYLLFGLLLPVVHAGRSFKVSIII